MDRAASRVPWPLGVRGAIGLKLDRQTASHWLWETLPARAASRLPLLGAVLRDGDYLSALRGAALVVPAASLLGGLLLGIVHPEYFFSYSVVVMVLLAIPAGLGASLGLWAWLGFVVGDVVLHPNALGPGPSTGLLGVVVNRYVPAAIVYLVLAGMMVMLPLTARSMAGRLVGADNRGALVLGHLLMALVQAAFVAGWAQAAAYLIRPAWGFGSVAPDLRAIQPLQRYWWVLAVVTAGAVVARFLLTSAAQRQGWHAGDDALPDTAQSRPRLPAAAAVGIKSVLFTLVCAGVLANALEAAVFAAVLAGVFFVQDIALPRAGWYAGVIEKVPALARTLVVVALGTLVGGVAIRSALASGSSSLRPMAFVILVALAAAALLFPAQRGEEAEG